MICLLAFMAGWAEVPRFMQATSDCCVTSDCCAKMDGAKGHKCPLDGRGCADCCNSCPLCFITILPAFIRDEPPTVFVVHSYGELPLSYVHQFNADVWRPPNVA